MHRDHLIELRRNPSSRNAAAGQQAPHKPPMPPAVHLTAHAIEQSIEEAAAPLTLNPACSHSKPRRQTCCTPTRNLRHPQGPTTLPEVPIPHNVPGLASDPGLPQRIDLGRAAAVQALPAAEALSRAAPSGTQQLTAGAGTCGRAWGGAWVRK